jgi:hypothetical protein
MASFFLKYARTCNLELMTGRGKLATKAAKSALKDQTCWESKLKGNPDEATE